MRAKISFSLLIDKNLYQIRPFTTARALLGKRQFRLKIRLNRTTRTCVRSLTDRRRSIFLKRRIHLTRRISRRGLSCSSRKSQQRRKGPGKVVLREPSNKHQCTVRSRCFLKFLNRRIRIIQQDPYPEYMNEIWWSRKVSRRARILTRQSLSSKLVGTRRRPSQSP